MPTVELCAAMNGRFVDHAMGTVFFPEVLALEVMTDVLLFWETLCSF